MRNLLILLSVLCVLTASSCGKKEKLSEQINKQLDSITHSMAINPNVKQFERLTANINDFISKFPKDSLASKYLFEEARIYQSQGEYKRALTVLDRLLKDFPGAKECGMSVFMEGFIYANLLNDLTKAKEKYELFLNKYGNENEKMAHDVKLELDNLGKSADEIFKQIQANADSLK
ncbi:MAG: hypothetical protein D4R43_02095 [Sphingobacteriales bacterium]|nr:MAG: hypothetical protein D4R43_02095 [Sphingobacteriales bacterium]